MAKTRTKISKHKIKNQNNQKQQNYLSDLKVGQKCRVVEFYIDDLDLKHHLFNIGLTKNVIIEVKKIAPLGDPIIIKLRGYILCIRKSDMKKIAVDII